MTNKYFTLEGNADYEANTLIMNDERGEFEALAAEGKAIKVDLSGYDSLRGEAKTRHEQYQKSRRKLLDSDDPIYNDKAKLNYELDKIKAAYDEDVESIRGRYDEYKADAMKQAQQMKAQATVRVSERDRETARQFVDRASINLLTQSESRKGEAVDSIINDIENLTEEQRQALRGELPSLLRSIDDMTARKKIADATQKGDKNSVAVKLAEQLPHDVALEYRIHQSATRKPGQRKY